MEHNKMAQMFFRRHYPFVIDKEGNIVFITKEYAAVLKRDQKSLLGKRVKDVIPDTRLIDVLESEREIFGEPYKISTGEVLICDYLLLRDENGKVEGACCLSPYFINSKYEQDVSLIERLHKKVNELESEKLRYRQELSELDIKYPQVRFSSAIICCYGMKTGRSRAPAASRRILSTRSTSRT